MTSATFVVLCLASVLATSLACTCPHNSVRTDTQIFCDSDFVVQVQVIKEEHIAGSGFTVYEVEIANWFKPLLAPLGRQLIYTPDETSRCGITMNVNNVYTIAGDFKQIGNFFIMFTDSCSIIANPSSFNPSLSVCSRGSGGRY
ncbi:Metalloproteinase inhibitor 3 [Mactra antiquata]